MNIYNKQTYFTINKINSNNANYSKKYYTGFK